MGGGSGGGNTTTTQKADPWIGVQPYLEGAYGQASSLYAPGKGPSYYPGSTVATPTAYEGLGQDMMAGQAREMGYLANNAQQNLYNMSSGGNAGVESGRYYANLGGGGLRQLIDQTGTGIGATNQAMNSLMGYGNSGVTQQGTGQMASSMAQLNQAGDFQNNPAFQAALQSAIRPVTQQFQEQVMPGIKQGAIEAGQMGSSRQGVAEGIASRGYMDTVGDIGANMGNAAYAQGLQALQASGQLGQNLANMGLGATQNAGALGQASAALGGQASANMSNLGSNFYGQGLTALGQSSALTNGVQQAQLAPGQIINQIGQQRTADQQAQLSDQVNRYNYQQNLPYTMISDYLSLLNGAQGGQTTSQQSGGGGSNRAMGALGGAGTGAMIGSAFAPGIGTAIGAGAGALYGLFM